MSAMYNVVRKLRRDALKQGVGVSARYNPLAGEYGFILYDLKGNFHIGGADPVPYSYTAADVKDYLKQ